MRLSFQPLNSDAELNDFQILTQLDIVSGSPNTVVIQLIDKEKQPLLNSVSTNSGLFGGISMSSPMYQRYIPASGATLTATFFRSQSGDQLTKNASALSSDDRSIWTFDISASESQQISSGFLLLTLTQGLSSQTMKVDNIVNVIYNDGNC